MSDRMVVLLVLLMAIVLLAFAWLRNPPESTEDRIERCVSALDIEYSREDGATEKLAEFERCVEGR